MVYFTQSKGHVCKSLVKARKPWLLLVIKRVVRHIFPACYGKICAASGVHCQSSADTAKRINILLHTSQQFRKFLVEMEDDVGIAILILTSLFFFNFKKHSTRSLRL